MRWQEILPRALVVAAALCWLAPSVQAQSASVEAARDSISMKAQQTSEGVQVEWRLTGIPPAVPSVITADINGQPLGAPTLYAYPEEDSTTAILLLVDSSDPRRQSVLDKQVIAIAAMLASARPHHQIGVAAFDADLRILRPIPSPPDAIIESVSSLRAAGQTTELYRAVRLAIDALKAVEADRKALFVFSDGQAEDKAYSHADAAQAAREANVSIYGVGYPASATRAVALQTLRRLSEDTGGLFAAAAWPSLDLPASFALNPFALLDSGGRVVFPLVDHYRLPFAATPPVSVSTRYGEAALSLALPIDLPFPQPHQWRRVWDNLDERPYAIAALTVAAALFVAANTVIVILVRRRSARLNAARPTGYLELLDSTGGRHPITTASFRIGRDPRNELVIPNTSVSAHHATLHRRRDGGLMITDLDSTNGIRVNDETVRESLLNDGDIVELGEVRLRFVRA